MIASTIKCLMKEHNLTQAQFAQRTKMCQPTVSRIIKNNKPSLKAVCQISEAFSLSYDDLLATGGKPGDKSGVIRMQNTPL
ncbi:helix-turn-helix domain-containing protein [Porticoccaceae bacterium]|nr:helix-turn-helix domain-containing protein [Porticoccaceae bacterium]MDB2343806.1 helix-turn-helix domain-containing protein [Porticoccaceae bacterium]